MNVAAMLGITWDGVPPGPYRLLPHAVKTAANKGFSKEAVLEAANEPHHTYDNGRFKGQKRHVRGTICAVVDPERKVVITAYLNTIETAIRPDQQDADALAYAAGSPVVAPV